MEHTPLEDDDPPPDSGVVDTGHARTESLPRNMGKATLAQYRAAYDRDEEGVLPLRPKTRDECHDGIRPCPFVSCKYNLYLDVDPRNGSIRYNASGEPDEVTGDSCALDVAERNDTTLESVGAMFGLTRERIRQVESKALAKLQKHRLAIAVREAGGFDDFSHTRVSAADDGDAEGGAKVPAHHATLPPEEEDCEMVNRLYERAIRERAAGTRIENPIRPPSPEPSAAPPLSFPPTNASAAVPALPKEPMAEPSPLTDKQLTIFTAYGTLVTEKGGKPSPLLVAERAGLPGTNGGKSAVVCSTLRAIERKGYIVPCIDDDVVKENPMEPPKKNKTTIPDAPPPPPSAPATTVEDPLKQLLLERRATHVDAVAAIDKLLATLP